MGKNLKGKECGKGILPKKGRFILRKILRKKRQTQREIL